MRFSSTEFRWILNFSHIGFWKVMEFTRKWNRFLVSIMNAMVFSKIYPSSLSSFDFVCLLLVYDVLSGEKVLLSKRRLGCIRDVSWHPYQPQLVSSSVSNMKQKNYVVWIKKLNQRNIRYPFIWLLLDDSYCSIIILIIRWVIILMREKTCNSRTAGSRLGSQHPRSLRNPMISTTASTRYGSDEDTTGLWEIQMRLTLRTDWRMSEEDWNWKY